MNFKRPQNISRNEQLKKQTLAREHLRDGTPHIVFNLINTDKSEDGSSSESMLTEKSEEVIKIINNGSELNLDYGIKNIEWRYLKTGKRESGPNLINSYHMISSVSEKDKYSKGYCNCVGTAIVGTSKDTGKEISFITHIDSDYGDPNKDYGEEHASMLIKSLNKNLEEIISNSEERSVDAVIFGGSGDDIKYPKVISRIVKNISEKLGFEPVILTGPGGTEGMGSFTNAYLDTQGRKIYIARGRTQSEDMDKPYYASQITNKEEK